MIPWYSCYALHGHVRSILCKVTVWREHGYPCRSLTHVYLKLFIVVSTGCHFYVSDSQMCYSCTCVMTTVLLLFPCRESFVVSPRLLIYFSISTCIGWYDRNVNSSAMKLPFARCPTYTETPEMLGLLFWVSVLFQNCNTAGWVTEFMM